MPVTSRNSAECFTRLAAGRPGRQLSQASSVTLGLILRAPNAVMSIGFVILFPVTFMSNIFVDPRTARAGIWSLAALAARIAGLLLLPWRGERLGE